MDQSLQLYTIVERLANLLKSESQTYGSTLNLSSVQHDVLHYLSICNAYSDNPLAVTRFLGLTKGTVSQTLKLIESKGLLAKIPDEKDKRQVHLKLTDLGLNYIQDSTPPEGFKRALDTLSERQREEAISLLNKCLNVYQNINQQAGFGVCKGCVYNLRDEHGAFQCGLTKEALPGDQVEKICIEFSE